MQDIEDKIIGVAKELFIRKGYEGTSMSDIALQAGINRPALHYHFRTKERMFAAVAGSIMNQIIPKAQQVVEGPQPFWDKVSQLIGYYMEVYRNNPDMLFFVLTESRRDLRLLEHLAENQRIGDYFRSLAHLVLREMEAGRLRTVPLPLFAMQILSQLLFPFMAKPVLTQVFCHDGFDFDTLLDAWKTYMLQSLKRTLSVEG